MKAGTGATLGSNLTFAGSGAFNLDNSNATGAVSGSLGTLSFNGGDSTVQTTHYGTQNVALTVGSLAARSAGATGRFVLGRYFTGDASIWSAQAIGTNGTNSKISITGQATGFIDPGIYFATNNNQANWIPSASSSDFAYYDASGYVRAINYGTDANTGNFGAGTAIGAAYSNWYVNLNGSQAAQTSGTFNTLRFSGAYSMNLAQNATFTIANGGLLVAGNNGYATIAGGAGIQAGNNTELIIRTDATSDGLRLDTPILANGSNALTKSGAGVLILNAANTFTGDTVVNDGTVIISNPLALQYSTLNYNNQGYNTLGAVSSIAATNQLGAYNQPGLVTFTGTSATFGGLKGAQDLQFAGVALTVGGNGQSTSYTGVLSGAGGSLTKTGTGTLILGAAATYTGATTVTSGALSIGGVQGTSGLTLAAGTSLIESSALTLNALTLGSVSGDALTLKLNSLNGTAITVTGSNAFAANGTTSLDLSGASYSPGTITLLKYAGTPLSSISNFAFTGVQGHVLGGLVNNTGNTSIDLQLTQDPVKWNGNASAAWDINTTQNWKLASSGTAAVYLQSGLPDMAVFDDTASGNFNVNVSTTVQPASLTVNNSANNYTFSGSGKISGATGLAKSGTGTLTLATVGNDYTGGTTVTGGALVLSASGALPTGGALTVNSAAVDLGGNNASVGAFSGSSGTITTNGASATFTANSGAAAAFDGSLQDGTGGGVLAFVKSGTGTLTLTGSSNYSGGTTVNGGTLQLGNGLTSNGSVAGNIANSASVAFANPADLAYSGAISGTGSVIKSGAGTLTLSGSNSYSGGTTISAGTLQLGDGTSSNGSIAGNIVNYGALTFEGPPPAEPMRVSFPAVARSPRERVIRT